jgi:hypothetical protein
MTATLKHIVMLAFILLIATACSDKPAAQTGQTAQTAKPTQTAQPAQPTQTTQSTQTAQPAQPTQTQTTSIQEVVEPTSKKVELEKRSIISDKVEILLPKDFTVMSEEMAKLKYPKERRPTLIFTDDEASVNVAFNYTVSKITDKEIGEFKALTKKNMENIYPSATWIKDDVVPINNKNVGILELTTPAIDTNIYNLMFFMELDGRILLASVNCTEEQMPEWQPIAHEIMESIKIK